MTRREPDITIVMPARNDAYLGNSAYRIETALNFLADEVAALGRRDDLEVLVVDWGSERPLVEALRLTDAARALTSFLIVPPAIAARHSESSPFPTPRVLNAGIRRARGRFVAQTVADILFPRETLAKMFALADPARERESRRLFVFNRKEIPREVVDREAALSELRELIATADETLHEELDPLLLVPADCQMMSKELWVECRGYDERYLLWGWSDADLNLRLDRFYGTVNVFDGAPLRVYHLEHATPDRRTRKQNPWFFGPFSGNDEGWGLGQEPLSDYDGSERSSARGVPPKRDSFIRFRTWIGMLKKFLKRISWSGLRVLLALTKSMIIDLLRTRKKVDKLRPQSRSLHAFR